MFALFAVAILALTFSVQAGPTFSNKNYPGTSDFYNYPLSSTAYPTTVFKGPMYNIVEWETPTPGAYVVVIRYSSPGNNASERFDGYAVFSPGTTSFQDHVSPSGQYSYSVYELFVD